MYDKNPGKVRIIHAIGGTSGTSTDADTKTYAPIDMIVKDFDTIDEIEEYADINGISIIST